MAVSLTDRVKKSQQAAIERGGRATPRGILKPDAAAALAALLGAGYSDTATGVISAALLDAEKKIRRVVKKA